jgi:hypothetical protein
VTNLPFRVGIHTERVREITDSCNWQFAAKKHNGMKLACTTHVIGVSEIAQSAQGEQSMSQKRDLRELCDAASKEQDPEKLRAIIAELIKALDERKQGMQHSPQV